MGQRALAAQSSFPWIPSLHPIRACLALAVPPWLTWNSTTSNAPQRPLANRGRVLRRISTGSSYFGIHPHCPPLPEPYSQPEHIPDLFESRCSSVPKHSWSPSHSPRCLPSSKISLAMPQCKPKVDNHTDAEIRLSIQSNIHQYATAIHNDSATKHNDSPHTSTLSDQSHKDLKSFFDNYIAILTFVASLAAALSFTKLVDPSVPSYEIIMTSWVWSIWFSLLSVSTRALLHPVTKRPMAKFFSDNEVEIIGRALVSGSRKMTAMGVISLAFGLFVFAFIKLPIGSSTPMLVLSFVGVIGLLILTMAVGMYHFVKNARQKHERCASTIPPSKCEVPEMKEIV